MLFRSFACVATVLAGCVAMNAASTITSATVNTVAAVGRAATGTANVVNRTVQQIPAAMMYGAANNRRIVIPVNRAARGTPVPRAQTRAVRQPVAVTAKPSPRKAPKPAKKTTKRSDEFLEVIPPELLDLLTQDQMSLQTIVQADALAGAFGETVYWELDDRAGTSRAEEPHRMGAFSCRVMVESLKIDGTATESRATACRTENTGWTLSF